MEASSIPCPTVLHSSCSKLSWWLPGSTLPSNDPVFFLFYEILCFLDPMASSFFWSVSFNNPLQRDVSAVSLPNQYISSNVYSAFTSHRIIGLKRMPCRSCFVCLYAFFFKLLRQCLCHVVQAGLKLSLSQLSTLGCCDYRH